MTQDPIDRYFARAVDADRAAYLAQFTEDAVVTDEGRTHSGADAIADWRGAVPPVTYTVRAVEPTADGRRAHAEIAGDFPGSPVLLRFDFAFAADGRITRLAIGV
jgi:hypothetical protein